MAVDAPSEVLATLDWEIIRAEDVDGVVQLRRSQHGAGAALKCRACGSVDVVAVPLEE